MASPPTGVLAGRYDIAELEYLSGYDPDDSSLLSCDQIPPNGNNIDFYCNPALDALYQQELTMHDSGLRQQAFIQIHRIYLMDFPFMVLYSPEEIWMVREGTHNYSPSPTVVDDWRACIGACNDTGAQVPGAHVANRTKPDSRQTRAASFLQDERKAAGFPQR